MDEESEYLENYEMYGGRDSGRVLGNTLTHSLTHSPTPTHSLNYYVADSSAELTRDDSTTSRPYLSNFFGHTPTQEKPGSATHSLTHSLTYSLTYLLTHSLTHPPIYLLIYFLCSTESAQINIKHLLLDY